MATTPSKKEQIDSLQLTLKQVTRGISVLNENQVQKIFNSTPRKFKYSRPAKGGGQWTYVRKGYVRRVLDSVFGFNWDFEIETTVAEAFEVAKLTGTIVLKGTITARTMDDRGNVTATISKTDFGRKEVVFQSDKSTPDGRKRDAQGNALLLDFGNDMKAAASDALKRCASQFGIAADVYDPDEFQEIEIVGSDEHSKRRKNTDQAIEDAKKDLKAQGKKVGEENE